MHNGIKQIEREFSHQKCFSNCNGVKLNWPFPTFHIKKQLAILFFFWVKLNFTGENIWGGLPWKRHFNVMDEVNHQKVLDVWDTTTTISPITKDVKC
jgi:hypothetical protein